MSEGSREENIGTESNIDGEATEGDGVGVRGTAQANIRDARIEMSERNRTERRCDESDGSVREQPRETTVEARRSESANWPPLAPPQ